MPEGHGYTLTRHDGKQALSMLEELTEIYLPAYAEPPYTPHPMFSREAFTGRTTRQASHNDFLLVTAHTKDGELAGFTFGLPFETGRWWRDASGSTPPDKIVKASKFSVIELVVAGPHRERGLAHRLLNTLLEGRPEEFAMLLAQPDAPVRKMYDRWGWTEVAKVQSQPEGDIDDALVLKL